MDTINPRTVNCLLFLLKGDFYDIFFSLTKIYKTSLLLYKPNFKNQYLFEDIKNYSMENNYFCNLKSTWINFALEI